MKFLTRSICLAFILIFLGANNSQACQAKPGMIGCNDKPSHVIELSFLEKNKSSTELSCSAVGYWTDYFGGIILINPNLTGTVQFPYCAEPASVIIIPNSTGFVAQLIYSGTDCQSATENLTYSGCGQASGTFTNADGGSGTDIWVTGTVAPSTFPSAYPNPYNYNISSNGTNIESADGGEIYVVNGYPVYSQTTYCPTCGQPVNLATGSMWHQLTDFTVAGRTQASSIPFQRTYLAQSVYGGGDFGPHWIDNWETQLVSITSGANPNIMWIDPHGGAFVFTRNSNNGFNSPPGFFGTLTEYSDHYTLQQTHDIIYTFSRNTSIAPLGRLISISEPHGETVQLTYSSGFLTTIQSPFAGSVTLQRDSSGHVTQVNRVRDSLSYAFTFDSKGSLASSSDFDNNTTTYAYFPNAANPAVDGLLSSITDPLFRVISYVYNSTQKVISQTEPGNATRTFAYSTTTNGPVTKVTDIDTQTTEYDFGTNYLLNKTIFPDGSTQLETWTSLNQLATQTDALGFLTKYGYDDQGNLSSIQKPLDPTPTLITYDQTFDVPTLITPLAGAPTSFTVNQTTGDVNQIQRVSGATTLALQLTEDAFGNLLSTNNGLTTYSNQTNANGLLTFVFDAQNPETRTFDTRGRVITRTFKSGRILTYIYDNYDRITQITDSNGPSVINSYDVVSRLLTRTVTDGTTNQTTTFAWDARDRLISTTDVIGEKTIRGYDSVVIIDKPISITDPKGHVTQMQYDNMDRLSEKIAANGGIAQYGYNLNGDLVSVIDPDHNLTAYTFDGNRRLSTKSQASLATLASGNTQAVTTIVKYFYDLAGKLIRQETDSATGGNNNVILKNYDPFDRLIESIVRTENNGTPVQVQDDSLFTYSPQLDAVALKTASNAVENLSFSPEPARPFLNLGFGVQATDPSNALNLIQDIYSITRDVTGQIGTIVNSSGITLISDKYDPVGRLTSSTGKLNSNSPVLKTALLYDSFGRKIKLAHSTGMTEVVSYDELNRVSFLSWKDAFDATFVKENLSYDPAGNISQKRRNDGALQLGYDAVNELISSSSSNELGNFEAYNQAFDFDLNGNRLSDQKLGTETFIANGIVSDSKSTFKSDKDGFGNITQEKNIKDGMSRKYFYRADNKLNSLDVFLGPQLLHVDYFFDALGRRVAKKIHQGQNTYTQGFTLLDKENKILLGKSGNGNISLYIDGIGIDEHLGEVNSKSAFGYATDELGSVLNSESAGESHEFGLYGEELTKYLNLSPNSNSTQYGFSGYTFDIESGTYALGGGIRQYNPNIGRFLQKDPIGFNGGGYNLYRYANNNPIAYSDPSGDCPVCAGIVLAVCVAGQVNWFVYNSTVVPLPAAAPTPILGPYSPPPGLYPNNNPPGYSPPPQSSDYDPPDPGSSESSSTITNSSSVNPPVEAPPIND